MSLLLHRPFAAGLSMAGALVIASCDSGTGPKGPGTPAAMQIISGNEQDGVAGRELDEPLVVRVVDDQGMPVQGQIVNFVVVSGGGSVFAGAGISNAQGIVQEHWRLGTSTAYEQRLEARAVDNETGEKLVFATFTATARPDAPASIEKLAGEGSGTAGSPVTPPPSLRVRDQYGNPVPGVVVTFALASGGGTITGSTPSTGSDGVATLGSWTLGPTAGAQTLTASAPGLDPVSFTVIAEPAPSSRLAFSTAPPATTASGAPMPTIVVRLEDEFGNTIARSGVPVTPSLVSGQGTVGGTTVQSTNDQGLATFHLVLSGPVGEKTLQFSAPDMAPVSAVISVTTGAAKTMLHHAGQGQQIPAGGTASVDPAVRVTDDGGNPLAGVQVTFAIVSGGGSITGATPVTDANGVATLGSWTVGTQTGSASVRASAEGLPAVTIGATITASTPTAMIKQSGDNQSGPAGGTLPSPLTVLIRDEYGNGVPGVTVSFDVTSGGGSLEKSSVATDASGFASAGKWTLGPSSGSQTVTASASGLTSVVFTATATAGGGLTLSKVSGDNQQAWPAENVPELQVVRLLDQFGNPVAGAAITWQASDGGSASGATVTDAQGFASSIRWTVSEKAETQRLTVSATVSGQTAPAPVAFTATVSPGLTADVLGGGSCAIQDGVTHCWGLNSDGRVGDGTTLTRTNPVRPIGVPAFDTIVVKSQACALTAQGELWCWGANYGATPTQQHASRRFLAFENGWGITTDGVLLSGGTTPFGPSVQWTALSVGGLHMCALSVDQVVYCRASYNTPALGRNDPVTYSELKPVESSSRYVSISAGETHTCAITTEGALHCWGRNYKGQVGTGGFGDVVTPTVVLSGQTVASVGAGTQHTCAVTTGGAAFCWGENGSGQLGSGGASQFPTPTPGLVKGDRVWSRVSVNGHVTCATRQQDGGVYCWGWPVLGFGPAMTEPHMVRRPR